MKQKIIGAGVVLLLLAIVGLSVSLGVVASAGTDECDGCHHVEQIEGLIPVEFWVRNELAKRLQVQEGAFVTAPPICTTSEPHFRGWINKYNPCVISVAYSIPITEPVTFVAVIHSSSVMYEFTSPRTTPPIEIESAGVLGLWNNNIFTPMVAVAPGTLTVTRHVVHAWLGSVYEHRFFLNGRQLTTRTTPLEQTATFQIRGISS